MKTKDVERDIHIGDKFFCFKDCLFESGQIIFKKGKIYESETFESITDESDNKYHLFTKPYWTQYLIKLKFISRYNYPFNEKIASLQQLQMYGYAYNRKTNEIIKL